MNAASGEQMIKVENLSKKYKENSKLALDDVSFELQKGEFAALLGPNGAGKTTLINVISGVVVRDSGNVSIAGYNIDQNRVEMKTAIGIVPQEIAVDNFFTVREILNLQSGYYGMRKNSDYIAYIAERLSLSDKMNSVVRSLSGGMKRRLLIAKALLHKPKILILDEPTAGVDINLRHDLYRFVKEMNGEGMTILLTTHYLEEAEELCSRILLIDEGRLIADKPKKEFLKMAGDFLIVKLSVNFDMSKIIDSSMIRENKGINKILEVPKNKIPELISSLNQIKEKIDDMNISSPGVEELFVRLTEKGGRN